SLQLAMGYTDATFDEPNEVLGVRAGDETLHTPSLTLSASADYVFGTLGNAELIGHVNYTRQDEQRANLDRNGPLPYLPKYSITKAHLTLQADRWHGRDNLTNTR